MFIARSFFARRAKKEQAKGKKFVTCVRASYCDRASDSWLLTPALGLQALHHRIELL